MDNSDRILAIRALHKSPGWTDYLKPDLEKLLAQLEREVLETDDLSDKDREAKRNEAKSIRKIIRKPERDLLHLGKQMKDDAGE